MQPSAESSPAAIPWPQRVLRWCVRWRLGLGLLMVVTVFALSSIPNRHPPRVHGLDKAQHVVEYFLVGLVFLNVATRGFARVRAGTLLGAWGTLLVVAMLDESYQRWIPGRSFDLWDLAASATGGLVALATALLLRAVVPQPGQEQP